MRALRERARTAVASDELRLPNLGDTGVLVTLYVAYGRPRRSGCRARAPALAYAVSVRVSIREPIRMRS